MERYQFTCRCLACTYNFPVFEHLSENDEHFDDFITKDLDQLENFSPYEAKLAVCKYSNYITNHFKKFPCYEISLLQECILRCYRIFEKHLTKENRRFVEC